MTDRPDLLGQKFGMLTPIRYVGVINRKSSYECQCDCGRTAIIRSDALIRPRGTKSCGCLMEKTRNSFNKDKRENGFRFGSAIFGYKRNASARGYDWDLTEDEAIDLLTGDCHYCGMKPHMIDPSHPKNPPRNGIDRIENTIGYVIGNCVSCCKFCNRAKATMPYDEFLNWIETVYNHRVNTKDFDWECTA